MVDPATYDDVIATVAHPVPMWCASRKVRLREEASHKAWLAGTQLVRLVRRGVH